VDNVDRIRKAVAAVKADRPAYEEVLDFYEKLFLAQETAKEQVQLEPVQISEELLSIKRKEELPLINREDFAIDIEASETLLREICRVATVTNDVLAAAGTRVTDALDKGTLEASVLFSKVLSADENYLAEGAQKLDIDKKILTLLVYSSIRPSLSLCAEQLATCFDKDAMGIVLSAAARLPCQCSGMKGKDYWFAVFAATSGRHGESTARSVTMRTTRPCITSSAKKKKTIGWMSVMPARSILKLLIRGK